MILQFVYTDIIKIISKVSNSPNLEKFHFHHQSTTPQHWKKIEPIQTKIFSEKIHDFPKIPKHHIVCSRDYEPRSTRLRLSSVALCLLLHYFCIIESLLSQPGWSPETHILAESRPGWTRLLSTFWHIAYLWRFIFIVVVVSLFCNFSFIERFFDNFALDWRTYTNR